MLSILQQYTYSLYHMVLISRHRSVFIAFWWERSIRYLVYALLECFVTTSWIYYWLDFEMPIIWVKPYRVIVYLKSFPFSSSHKVFFVMIVTWAWVVLIIYNSSYMDMSGLPDMYTTLIIMLYYLWLVQGMGGVWKPLKNL